jgi:hypothetical protein
MSDNLCGKAYRGAVVISVQALPMLLLVLAAPASPGALQPSRAAFVIGADLPEGDIASLDSTGRVIAAAKSKGSIYQLAVCPGGERVVAVSTGAPEGLAVPQWVEARALPSLDLIWRYEVGGRFVSVQAITCRDSAAEDVLLFEAGSGSHLFHLSQGSKELISEPVGYTGDFVGDRLILHVGERPDGVVVLEAETGRIIERHRIAGLPWELLPSPDGRYMAGIEDAGTGVFVADLTTDPVKTHTFPLPSDPEVEALRHLTWIDENELAVLPSWPAEQHPPTPIPGPEGRASVFDASLTLLGSFRGWFAFDVLSHDDQLYGTAYGGHVQTADPQTGNVRTLFTLPASGFGTIAVVPHASPREVEDSSGLPLVLIPIGLLAVLLVAVRIRAKS